MMASGDCVIFQGRGPNPLSPSGFAHVTKVIVGFLVKGASNSVK